eukprot:scaffold324_cov394-Prasinococcus_capsulatus_cf.AAC.7
MAPAHTHRPSCVGPCGPRPPRLPPGPARETSNGPHALHLPAEGSAAGTPGAGPPIARLRRPIWRAAARRGPPTGPPRGAGCGRVLGERYRRLHVARARGQSH